MWGSFCFVFLLELSQENVIMGSIEGAMINEAIFFGDFIASRRFYGI